MEPNLLHIIKLQYLESDDELPFRAIGIGFSDGVMFTVTRESMAGLIENYEIFAQYEEAVTNVVMNEQDYWFDGNPPRVSTHLMM